MPPDVANIGTALDEQFADHLLRLTAVRTLKVAVFNDRYRGVFGTASVIALRVHLGGEIEDVLGRAGDLPGATVVRDVPDRVQDQPGECRPEDQRAERADLRLHKMGSVECEARDQQRDGETYAGERPAREQYRPAER